MDITVRCLVRNRRFMTALFIVACITLFIICYVFTINSIERKHKVEMETMQALLTEAQATPEPVFVRGASKYTPSQEEYFLTREEVDLFKQFLVLECGLTENEFPPTNTTMYSIGAVVMNRVESPYFPDTVMEVLAQFPTFVNTPDLTISRADKRMLMASMVVDDLVNHNYRPIDQDILFYAPQGALYNVPGQVAFETIDFCFYKVVE